MSLLQRAGTLVRRGLTAVMTLALVGGSFVVSAPAPAVAATTLSAGQQQAVALVARSRSDARVPALAVCSDLTDIAQAWSRQMASSGRLAHNPKARDQIRGWSAWGENVGVGSSVSAVHSALLKSSGHRKNLLSTSYSHVGVGVAEGGGRVWVTQVFRKPKSGQGCTAPATAPGPLPRSVARVAGPDRFATAASLSRGAFSSARTVIIASGHNFPDALAAAPLSSELGAPILLSSPTSVPAATVNEIQRLGASNAVLLGSTSTLSSAVDKQLVKLGLRIERLAGPDRYATAAKIATRVGGRTVVIAKGAGNGWVDAIAATGYAAHEGLPVLLVDGRSIAAPTRSALKDLNASNAVIVGGPAAVSSGIEGELKKLGIKVRRLAGADRLATSAAVADASVAVGMSASKVWVSTAYNWADALSAGPAVARSGDVLLLSDPRGVNARAATGTWFGRHSDAVDNVVLVGGGKAVHDQVGHDVARIIGS